MMRDLVTALLKGQVLDIDSWLRGGTRDMILGATKKVARWWLMGGGLGYPSEIAATVGCILVGDYGSSSDSSRISQGFTVSSLFWLGKDTADLIMSTIAGDAPDLNVIARWIPGYNFAPAHYLTHVLIMDSVNYSLGLDLEQRKRAAKRLGHRLIDWDG